NAAGVADRQASRPTQTNIVHGWGRGDGRGTPAELLNGRSHQRPMPVRRRRTAPDETRTCGQTRASEMDHRRLFASSPPLHDHRRLETPPNDVGNASRLPGNWTKYIRALPI